MSSDRSLHQSAAVLPEQYEYSPERCPEIFQHYATLKNDHELLRSRYERLVKLHEPSTQTSPKVGQDPFVLVLVNGNGYVFDDFVKGGIEGGQWVAQLLNNAVESSLQEKDLGHCRIMVRVYANLDALVLELLKETLNGRATFRFLTRFVANFTASRDMFDFVDAGRDNDSADAKICAMLRHVMDNAQCKHIYFAGCHDVRNVKDLEPFRSDRERITLVRNYAFHPSFNNLDLGVEEFPGIFRPGPPGLESSEGVCRFFQSGICRWGAVCKYSHILLDDDVRSDEFAGILNGIESPKEIDLEPACFTSPMRPIDMEQASYSSPMRSLSDGQGWSTSNQRSKTDIFDDSGLETYAIAHDAGQIVVKLPVAAPISVKASSTRIPVNRDGHRLDPHLPHTSPKDFRAYKAYTSDKKLCSRHHILGYCYQGDSCTYDHLPIDPGVLNVHCYFTRRIQCSMKGSCRRKGCFQGHLCLLDTCDRARCRFDNDQHDVDTCVAQYVYPLKKFAQHKSVSASKKVKQSAEDAGGPTAEGAVIPKDTSDERMVCEIAELEITGKAEEKCERVHSEDKNYQSCTVS